MFLVMNADNNVILFNSNRLYDCLQWFYKSGYKYAELWKVNFRERKVELLEEWVL